MFPSLSVYFCKSVKCPSVSCYLLEKHLLGTNPDSEEADTHAQQQSTPVHRLTAHHAVIAVLASVNQRVEVPAVHAKYFVRFAATKIQNFSRFLLFLQSIFYSILHFIALLQRVGNFNDLILCLCKPSGYARRV